MAIKINLMPSKEDIVVTGEPSRPFYFLIVFVFFLISSLVYVGIFSYKTFILKKQLDAIEKKTIVIQEEVYKAASEEELSNVSTAVVKGKNIKSILSSRFYGSKIYELLEKITIKSISYSELSEIVGDSLTSVIISGEADNFSALAKQLVVFKKTKEIKEAIFSEAVLGKDSKVAFSVTLNLDSKFLATRPIITLSGSNLIKIAKGSKYSDAGATAVDGVDGPIKVTTTGSVDTSIAGTYTLAYDAVNTAGNSTTITRVIIVE